MDRKYIRVKETDSVKLDKKKMHHKVSAYLVKQAFLGYYIKAMDQSDHVARLLPFQLFQFVYPHFCKK